MLLANVSSNPVVEPPPRHSPVTTCYENGLWPVSDRATGLSSRAYGTVRRPAIAGATEALFPDKSPLDTFLAVSEVIGHLDLLEIEGQIEAEREDGVIVWRFMER